MTSKPKILATRQFPENVLNRLNKDFVAVINPTLDPMPADEVIRLAGGMDGIICDPTCQFNEELISRLPDSIKIVTTFSVGYDHLNVEALKKRGIALGNTPDVLTDATADIAMLCLLGASRMAYSAGQALRRGDWSSWSPIEFLGTHVSGKKLAILGMGRIGEAVARRAQGFDMEIHYHNRRPVKARGLENATYHETLDSLLPHAEFLSINCPLTDQTHHMINEDAIVSMPDGAVLVNTARGPIIDDTAVLSALKSGKLASAGLDVFEGEPNFNKGYLELTNVFLLPHIGSATHETRDQMGFKCLDNLDAFFAGKPVPNPI